MADYEHLFRWKEEGFEDFEQQLLKMSKEIDTDKLVQATVVKALKRAVQPIHDRAVFLAPVDTEKPRDAYRPIHMRDTIRSTARIPNASDMESVYREPGDIAIGIVSVKKSAVSLANEFGTSRRGARPFLRTALRDEAFKAIDILKDELSNIIPAYAARLARKRK